MKKAKLAKFRELRKKKGVNLDAVAKELNVSKAYVSMVETGKRSLDYQMAINMAKIFDSTPDELFLDDMNK
ncbi:MAG: helix-turn-helix transcriptional regulator [Erysipelotrichales bacterium]|nr:helix-turn-helix transcriptional regulator [Erysipelotrichales bacterium]